jgi:hypothetical protein
MAPRQKQSQPAQPPVSVVIGATDSPDPTEQEVLEEFGVLEGVLDTQQKQISKEMHWIEESLRGPQEALDEGYSRPPYYPPQRKQHYSE